MAHLSQKALAVLHEFLVENYADWLVPKTVLQGAETYPGIDGELKLFRKAFEYSQMAVIVATETGEIEVITTEAMILMKKYLRASPMRSTTLPEKMQAWLQQQRKVLANSTDIPPSLEPLRIENKEGCLVVRPFLDQNQSVLLLEEEPRAVEVAEIENLNVTRREAEILSWVTCGKTNNDIA